MKDTQATDSTHLNQPYLSWPEAATDIWKTAHMDAEPFRKAPAPWGFQAPGMVSRFTPDPLLAVTPEKALGRARAEKTSCADEAARKGRQRVRFAADPRSSPPSKNPSTDAERRGRGGADAGKVSDDDESVPRSFSAVTQKLYQPGRYADGGDGRDSSKMSSAWKPPSGSPAPKGSSAEALSSKVVHAPMGQPSKNLTGAYTDLGQDRQPIAARIVRHKPAKVCEYFYDEATSTEVKEIFKSPLNAETPPQTLPRSCSSSPSHRQSSPHQPGKASPNRCHPSPSSSPSRHCSSSPSRSPGRLTPVEGLEVTPDLEARSEPVVLVVREAPYLPKHSDYVFPFDGSNEGRQVYDSSVENPLARPEFNSALKIGEELKSVKGKRPDTWEAVSHKLKTCERKKTEIQEKASSKVNVQMQSGLYADLVDVDVALDDLCQSVERGITLRAPSSKPPAVKVPVGKEPDLMEFFYPELQPELPDLTLTGLQPITESLTTANPVLAFDLYRHNRSWNGLTDG